MVVDDQLFKQIVKNSNNISDVLRKLDLSIHQGNYLTIKRRINLLGIDTSHFSRKTENKKIIKYPNGLSDILVQNSTYASSNHLKNKLIKNGVLKNFCSICGQQPEWNGKPMIMILDHINGVHTDNRLENLRLVCPNCNSQLDTSCGKNVKDRKKYICSNCGKEIYRNSKTQLCKQCWKKYRQEHKIHRKKKNTITKKHYICSNCGKKIYKNSKTQLCKQCWIKYKQEHKKEKNKILQNSIKQSVLNDLFKKYTKEQIKNLIEEKGYSFVGNLYNVTGNCVKRWIKKNNISIDLNVIKERQKKIFESNMKKHLISKQNIAKNKRICKCGNKKMPFAKMCRQCWLKEKKNQVTGVMVT